jgi:hypothetical protein
LTYDEKSYGILNNVFILNSFKSKLKTIKEIRHTLDIVGKPYFTSMTMI